MTARSAPDFLVHRDGDMVAVAVTDIEPGAAHGAVLASDRDVDAQVRESVPLGHKFALTDIADDAAIIEYGVPIGVALRAISRGSHVHTHNIRSARWQSSIVS